MMIIITIIITPHSARRPRRRTTTDAHPAVLAREPRLLLQRQVLRQRRGHVRGVGEALRQTRRPGPLRAPAHEVVVDDPARQPELAFQVPILFNNEE